MQTNIKFDKLIIRKFFKINISKYSYIAFELKYLPTQYFNEITAKIEIKHFFIIFSNNFTNIYQCIKKIIIIDIK